MGLLYKQNFTLQYFMSVQRIGAMKTKRTLDSDYNKTEVNVSDFVINTCS